MWNKLSNHATTIQTNVKGETLVTYHTTTILKFTDNAFTLDSGKFPTATTKKKMNQAAAQFSLPYRVSQDNYRWRVTIFDDDHNPISASPFFDGITYVKDNNGDWHRYDPTLDHSDPAKWVYAKRRDA